MSHSLYLVLAIIGVWFWTNQPSLAAYDFYLAIFVIVCYLFSRYFRPGLIFDTIIYTIALLLVVTATGGLNSSFFFLTYFLIFAVALLFEPFLTLTLTLSLSLFFLNQINSLHTAVQTLSLFLISLLAIIFGRQYLRLLESQKKIKRLIAKENRLEQNLGNEESDTLLWLSLNFKGNLLKITHQASELLADNRLPLGKTARDSLQSIHETAKNLLKSGGELQEKIDKETD